jgi:hypothetical protein
MCIFVSGFKNTGQNNYVMTANKPFETLQVL